MLSLKKMTFFGEKSLFVGRGLRKSIFTPSHQGIILKIILKRWNDNIYLKIALIQPAVYGLYKSSTHFWHLDFNNIVISIQYMRYSAVLYHYLEDIFYHFFVLSISSHNMKWKSVIKIEKYADRATKEFQLSWREKDRWTCSLTKTCSLSRWDFLKSS